MPVQLPLGLLRQLLLHFSSGAALMKILVLAISRGRPLDLSATLLGFKRLESGRHEIRYVVRFDEDDETLPSYYETLKGQDWVTAVLGPRPITLGEALNSVVRTFPEWDVLNIVPDDIHPLSPSWDHHIALAASRDHAGSWRELADPANPTLPFITRHWYDRVGRAMPEWFPFWFSDVWIGETFAFAYDKPITIYPELSWYGTRGRTTNMRDIEFWLEVWIKSRPERIAEAQKLFGAYLPAEATALWTTHFEKNDQWLRENVLRLQSILGDPRPPSEQYLQAKTKAEAFLTPYPT